MIIFTIAFGEAYIKSFFELCLPSLVGPDRPLKLQGEKVSLRVVTLARDAELVGKYTNSPAVRYFSTLGPIHVDSVTIPADTTDPQVVSTSLLVHAVTKCIEANEVFVHAVPDVVYTAGLIDTCYELHSLTGRVIGLFNGRVGRSPGEPEFTPQTLLDVSKSGRSMVDFFFEHMHATWRENVATDPKQVKGTDRGHVVFQSDRRRMIFFPTPNPFLGKFAPADLIPFSGRQGFTAWDHAWTDSLVAKDRLLVQTDLDAGFGLEAGSWRKDGSQEFKLPRAFHRLSEQQGLSAQEALRDYKFGHMPCYCFTSTR